MHLYKRFNSGWKEFSASSFCTRRKKYQLIDSIQCGELPANLELASLYLYRGHIILESCKEYKVEQQDLSLEDIYNPYIHLEFNTLKLKLDAAIESPRTPLNNYRLPDDNGEAIADAIKSSGRVSERQRNLADGGNLSLHIAVMLVPYTTMPMMHGGVLVTAG